jgi:hypothetical protein
MTQSSQPRSGKTKRSSAKQPASKKSKSSGNSIDPEQRQQMIAETAYFIAEARGFDGECQLDDWLQAEAMIDRQLSGRQPS